MRLPRIQFSLFGLLAAMAVFGVALACIVKFGLSLPMVTIIWSVLLVTLMVTPVLAFVGKPERRAFHAGFAWFGWMYILIYATGSYTTGRASPLRFPYMSIERGISVVYKWVVPPASRVFYTGDPESEYDNMAANYDSRIWIPSVNPAPLTTFGGSSGFASSPVPGGGFFWRHSTDGSHTTSAITPLSLRPLGDFSGHCSRLACRSLGLDRRRPGFAACAPKRSSPD